MNLLEKLEVAGLNVFEYPNWDTRTMGGKDRTDTVGILNHWDAIKSEPPAAYYTSDEPDNRFKGDLYHIVIRRNGDVELLQQRYAWHAGKGSSNVLQQAQDGEPIVPDDLNDTNGNPWFFAICINYHPDDGPISNAQYDAMVKVNKVVMLHYDLSIDQIMRHMDWSDRKRDIDTMSLEAFKQDVEDAEVTIPNYDDVSWWAQDSWVRAYNAGLITDASQPKDNVTVEQLMVFFARLGLI